MKNGKKLSMIMIAAIVMVIVALGVKIFTKQSPAKQEFASQPKQKNEDTIVKPKTNQLFELAEKNGIELSNDAKDKIQKALNQNKENFSYEMLMELAKADFGQQPQEWSLAQQKWFFDVTVAMGLFEQTAKEMPLEGESSKLPVIQAAKEYVWKTYSINAPLDNPQMYQIGTQYINGDVEGDYPGMYWSIDFQPKYLEGAEYWVYLRDDLSVFHNWVRNGIQAHSTTEEILDAFSLQFGGEHTWDQRTLRSFKEAITHAVDSSSKAYLALAKTSYPDIPANAISREKAHSVAVEQLGMDARQENSHVFLIGDVPNPVWKVMIVSGKEQWYAEIDSVTGTIKSIKSRDIMHMKWWMPLVLNSTIEEMDTIKNNNKLPSVG